LDRHIIVKFFRVLSGNRVREPLAEKLRLIAPLNQARATRIHDGVPFWCDKIVDGNTYIAGRFCRKQSTNLPPKAPATGGLEPLGVGSLGRTVAWLYHPETSVIAIEATREGLTLSRFLSYITDVCECPRYTFMPVTTDSNLQQLRESRVRSLSFRVATPRDLAWVTPEQEAVKSGLENVMSPNLSTFVEVKYGLSIGDSDIRPTRVRRLAAWLKGEKDANRGDVTKLRAGIIDADGDSKTLELLDEVHLAAESDLDLPDDDPERSYSVRKIFVASSFQRHYDSIIRQFGPE
jgi:hypothetical protein